MTGECGQCVLDVGEVASSWCLRKVTQSGEETPEAVRMPCSRRRSPVSLSKLNQP